MDIKQINRLCTTVQTKLKNKKQPLNALEVAEYLNYFSRIFFRASQLNSVKDYESAAIGIYKVMDDFSKKINPKETKIIKFLKGAGAHGILEIVIPPDHLRQTEKVRLQKLRLHLIYNGLHWGGVANILGGKTPLRNTRIYLRTGSINFNRNGKIEFTGNALKEIVYSTPHLVHYGLGELIRIRVKGKAEMTLGDTFTLLRSASNSLHSLKINAVLFGWRNALQKPPELISETADKLAHKNEFDIPAGMIRPSAVKGVKERLGKGIITEFEDYQVLTKVANLPLDASAFIFDGTKFGVKNELFMRALNSATGTSRLDIQISKGKAKVSNTGLGRIYKEIAKYRFGSGTSNFLQKRSAKIHRKFRLRGKPLAEKAIVKLRFRRPKRAA